MVLPYDVHTGSENTGKQLMADGGAALDRDTIREADDLEELRDTYQQEGLSVDSVEEAYAQARQDWWEQVREDDFGSVTELPGDSVTVSVDHDGDRYETTFHVHGVAHGQQLPGDIGGGIGKRIQEKLEMSDEVRDFLQDEVEGFYTAGEPVYVEHGFGEIIYPDGASVPLHDTDDQKTLAAEMGESFDARFKAKMLVGTAYGKSAGLKNTSIDEKTQTKQMMDMQRVSTDALKEVDVLPDLQNAIEASHLPYHLEEEYGDLVAEDMQDKADQIAQSSSGLLGGIVDKAKQWAAESAADIGTDLEYRRSEIMVEKALPKLYDENVTDVHLVVGAGHHPSAVQYLEDLEADDLRQYAPGA